MKTFRWKYLLLNICAQHINCVYLLEPSPWGGSNKYPHSMFWAEIRKLMYTPLTPVLLYKSRPASCMCIDFLTCAQRSSIQTDYSCIPIWAYGSRKCHKVVFYFVMLNRLLCCIDCFVLEKTSLGPIKDRHNDYGKQVAVHFLGWCRYVGWITWQAGFPTASGTL